MKALLMGEPFVFIEIDVNRRSYPDSVDDPDRNWLSAVVKAGTPGFTAQFGCNVLTDELKTWIDRLALLLNSSEKEIVLANMEENIEIKCATDLYGHVLCACKLRNSGNIDAVLCFKIETSGISIQEFQNMLKRILLEYQVF
jgi:hypothetical protein